MASLCLCVFFSDDFSPVLQLGRNNIEVWPIRLPARISFHNDTELQGNLRKLRESEKNKIILHSTRRDTVHYVMMAVRLSVCLSGWLAGCVCVCLSLP